MAFPERRTVDILLTTALLTASASPSTALGGSF